MIHILRTDMLCLLQEFVSQKDSENKKKSDKPKKTKRLSILRRKKSSFLSRSQNDENKVLATSNNQLDSRDDTCRQSQLCLSGTSTPSMTQVPDASVLTAQQTAAAAAAEAILNSTPGSSKARQKKFHRHFKQVSPDERVLNYYSCALVTDILLQGHLYITKNYFAFYSNVFGYVTKLLIPVTSVLGVTKEKTAYIIPNAVAVTTEDDKHVFSSLLSRDSTYKLMVQVWSSAITNLPAQALTVPDAVVKELESNIRDGGQEESSLSGSESFLDAKISAKTSIPSVAITGPEDAAAEPQDVFKTAHTIKPGYSHLYTYISSLPQSTILLFVSTLLLILLFISASVLLYKISHMQSNYSRPIMLNTRSLDDVQDFLNTNLDHLLKVRQSLEALSLLIENEQREKMKRGKLKDYGSLETDEDLEDF